MPGKDYTYAYQNIRNELEGIHNTLWYMENKKTDLTKYGHLEKLKNFKLDEKIDENTYKTLSELHQLFTHILDDLAANKEYALLKLRIERLDEPDLQNFIRDMSEDKSDMHDVAADEPRQIVYQQEYSEEYGAIMRPYQLIDGHLHPCHIDREGNVTLMGDDSYS